MRKNTSTEGFNRRTLLKTLGATTIAGLAGCTGGDNNEGGGSGETPTPEPTTPEPTTEEARDIQEIPLQEFTALWLQETDDDVALFVSAFHPPKVYNQLNETVTENEYGAVAYEPLNYAPRSVPRTVIQYTTEPEVSAVKVDQLPATVSGDDVASALTEAGFESESPEGPTEDDRDYAIYRNPSEDAVYAVSSDRVVIGVNYSNSARSASNDLHHQDVETILEARAGSESGLTNDMEAALAALDIQDAISLWEYNSDNADLVQQLDPQYQPTIGATSVDLEEEIQYGAWKFDSENLAEWVHADLEEGGAWYEWERIERDGDVITAAGESQAQQQLNGNEMYLALPKI